MRALPLQPTLFAGETVGSFYARLAKCNELPPGELWTAIRKNLAGLPLRTTPHLATGIIEELGGLAPGHFREDAVRQTLYIRCEHHGWARAPCRSCVTPPPATRMCTRCSAGEVVEVRRRAGAFCIRHGRWHYEGNEGNVPDPARYRRAERRLSGTLWPRGIALGTGEIELAAELMHVSDPTISEGTTRASQVRAWYPEAVRLAEFLTEPWACQFLAVRSIGSEPVVALIEGSIAAVRDGVDTDLMEIGEAFRATGREASIATPRRARSRHAMIVRAGHVRGFVRNRMPRVRGAFLKHNDARDARTP